MKIGGIGLNIMRNPYDNDQVMQDYKIYER